MGTDLRFIIPTAGTPLPPDTNHVVQPGVGALDLAGINPVIRDIILWDAQSFAFLGFKGTQNTTAINLNTIYTNVTSGQAPLVVHASAANTTADGTETLTGDALNPYMHLSYVWRVLLNDSLVPSDDEITDPNTLESVDMYIDQVGPEAKFIFHNPGTYSIILIATAANGVTNQDTQLVTVNVPTYAHKWFDPDFGPGGDGRQHWDASALTNGTYTNVSGILTQVGSGAFTNYDHAAATAQTYGTDNYNWIWISGFGHKRIASKTNEDTIVLLDKLGSDQTGVTSSTGPLLTFDPATDVDDDTMHHLKGGNTYLVSSGIVVAGTPDILFSAWGGGQATIKASTSLWPNSLLQKTSASLFPDTLSCHNIIFDGDRDSGSVVARINLLDNSGDTSTNNIVFDRCKVFNFGGDQTGSAGDRSIYYGGSNTLSPINFTVWDCELDNRKVGAGPEGKADCILGNAKAGSHTAIVGTSFWGESNFGATFVHHIYISGTGGHRDYAYNDFLANVQDISYCINENCGNDIGDPASTNNLYVGNRFRNADWGLDGSNANNDRIRGTFEDSVIILNSFDGTIGTGNLGAIRNGGGIFWASTTSAFIGYNMALSLPNNRGLYDRFVDAATDRFYFDGNTTYNCPVARVQSGVGNFQIINNTVTGDDVAEELISYDPINNGVDTFIQDNLFYAPNDSTPYNNDGTPENLASLNGHTGFSGNTESNPGFNDAINADFRTRLDVKFEVVRFTTASGTVPFTQTIPLSTGFGVPKGCIIHMSMDKNGGAGYANGSFTIGCSDGTKELCMETGHDSEGPGSNPSGQGTFNSMWDNQVTCRWPGGSSGGGSVMQLRISVDSFGADEIVLQIDEEYTPRQENIECCLIAIGGTDVEDVVVGNDNLGNGTSAVPITVGHEPDLFFAFARDESYFNNFDAGFGGGPTQNSDFNCKGTYGYAINDGSESQMGMAWYAVNENPGTPAHNTLALYNDSILGKLDHSDVEDYSISLTSFTATGVELTPSADSGDCKVGYLSVKFRENVNMAIVDTTIETSGDFSATGAGFEPGFGIGVNINGPTVYNTATDASFALTATYFDASTTVSVMNNGLDGGANQDNSSNARASSLLQMMHPGDDDLGVTIDVSSSGHAFTADGVDFTMTNWPANQVIGRMLLLGVN